MSLLFISSHTLSMLFYCFFSPSLPSSPASIALLSSSLSNHFLSLSFCFNATFFFITSIFLLLFFHLDYFHLSVFPFSFPISLTSSIFALTSISSQIFLTASFISHCFISTPLTTMVLLFLSLFSIFLHLSKSLIFASNSALPSFSIPVLLFFFPFSSSLPLSLSHLFPLSFLQFFSLFCISVLIFCIFSLILSFCSFISLPAIFLSTYFS